MDTGFSDLPVTVQLKILNLSYPTLTGASWPLVNLRLVNKEWLKLVMYMERIKFTINNWSLDIFSKVDQIMPIVGELTFIGHTKPLPIWSATRKYLPHAKSITICNGVSSANILKLLRYYVGNCTSLKLVGICLQTLKPYQISSVLPVGNIRKLELVNPFYNEYYTHPLQIEFLRNQQARILAEIFNKIRFPNLRNFILIWGLFDNPIPIPPQQFSHQFLLGLFSFLKKHGQELESLKIDEDCLYIFPMLIENLQHLTQLEQLEVSVVQNSYNLFIPADFHQLLSSVKTLKELKLCIGGYLGELEVIQCLLANNSETLRTFHISSSFSGCIRSLDFLYSNPNLKITDLKISEIENMAQVLEMASTINYKLPTVKYLALDFVSFIFFHDNDPLLPWKENLIKWITQMFPNLEDLKLGVMPHPFIHEQLEPQYISSLIQGLPKLARLNLILVLDGFSAYINHGGAQNLISPEAERWIFSNYPKCVKARDNNFYSCTYILNR